MDSWRLIPSFSAPGIVQMAIDRWLFEQHCRGLSPPVLRFYTWEPAAISLGFHQKRIPPHWRSLTWEGKPIDLVQRPTGGRAVLHQGDLTYAIVCSGLPSDRTEAYRYICQFLIEGWRSLSVPLFFGLAGRGYIHNPNCFGTATAADLVTETGAKLIGSAQLRQQNAILQHGSMQLAIDRTLFRAVFDAEIAPAEIPPALTIPDGYQMIINALTTAAESCFNATFTIQPLDEQEWKIVDKLASAALHLE